MTTRRLNELNASQRRAAATRSGPLLVLAGAGTGKTRVVTYRIAHLIDQGIAPDRILAVTFTNKAAGEMQERIAALLGKLGDARPEISTFHSFCSRVLRRQGRHIGLRENYTIYAGSQPDSLARRVLAEVNMDGIKMKPSDLLSRINGWKTIGLGPEAALEIVDNDVDHLAAIAYRRYQTSLRTLNAVDFDDLLMLTAEIFQNFADARREEASRLDHILVDEYQDTNATQYRIVKTLAARHRNLCVVGDDDQSIYGWRGAEVQHILNFRKDWPEAKVVRLQENYRSTGEILRLANRLIQCNTVRHDKKLKPTRGVGVRPRILACADEQQEAQIVVEDIRAKIEHEHRRPSDMAILFRTNQQTRPLESELRRMNIPYILLGGMSFFDRREVRDALAFLKLLDDPRDDPSLLRVANVPARGISDRALGVISKRATDNQCSCWELIQRKDFADVTPSSALAMTNFAELIERHRRRLQFSSPVDTAKSFINDVSYAMALKQIYPNPLDNQSRWNNVREIVQGVEDFHKRNSHHKNPLGGYINELALRGSDYDDGNANKLKQNAVGLLTLHAAKGLEFPSVHLVGLEEGLLPHHRSLADAIETGDGPIEEERRLCYVGITRAEQQLTISFCKGRRQRNKVKPCKPSRFLSEMLGKPIDVSQEDKGRASPSRSQKQPTSRNRR